MLLVHPFARPSSGLAVRFCQHSLIPFEAPLLASSQHAHRAIYGIRQMDLSSTPNKITHTPGGLELVEQPYVTINENTTIHKFLSRSTPNMNFSNSCPEQKLSTPHHSKTSMQVTTYLRLLDTTNSQ